MVSLRKQEQSSKACRRRLSSTCIGARLQSSAGLKFNHCGFHSTIDSNERRPVETIVFCSILAVWLGGCPGPAGQHATRRGLCETWHVSEVSKLPKCCLKTRRPAMPARIKEDGGPGLPTPAQRSRLVNAAGSAYLYVWRFCGGFSLCAASTERLSMTDAFPCRLPETGSRDDRLHL